MTDEAGTTVCPGCGLRLPDRGGVADSRYRASGECWDLYSELSAYSLGRGYQTFIHQHVVDAYGAQHAISSASNIGVAFSLIGLYLAVEHGFAGRHVQQAHMRLARVRKPWPKLEPPQTRASLTVADVMRAKEGDERDSMILRWAAAVWAVWSDAHPWTRNTCNAMLDVRPKGGAVPGTSE